jgi:LysM repeat protein
MFRPKYATTSSTSTTTKVSSVTKTATTSASSTYTVVKGDTLSGIGTKLGVAWKDIATANNIKSPYTIKVGQKLTIPSTTKTTSSSSSSSYKAKVSSTNGVYIRKSTSTSSTALGAIPYNKEITVTNVSNAWAKTTYNKITGYVSLSCIKKI